MRHALLLVFLFIATSARADTATYDLTIRGLKVGVLTLASEERAGRYTLSGRIGNSGVTRVIRKFNYRGTAVGRLRGRTLLPSEYAEVADTGMRQSEVVMTYRGGVPTIVTYTSPREAGPDTPAPETQGGTLDPLTAVYAFLRDVPPGEACDVNVVLFDGRRQSSIQMRPAGEEDGLPVCVGRYERRLGFTAEEVTRHRHFDFRLRYAPAGNLLRVEEVVFQSLYGQAAIRRQ